MENHKERKRFKMEEENLLKEKKGIFEVLKEQAEKIHSTYSDKDLSISFTEIFSSGIGGVSKKEQCVNRFVLTCKSLLNNFNQEIESLNKFLDLKDKNSFSPLSTPQNIDGWFYVLKDIQIKCEKIIKKLEEKLKGKNALDFSRKYVFNIKSYDLHPSIKKVSEKRFRDGHYADAVESAFKEVIKRVKEYYREKTGEELDGDKLMNRVFGCENQEPIIKFNSLRNQEEKDEQRGLMFLFKGIVGIRNRKAHENIVLSDPNKAIEYLSLASLLMRLLDECAK